VRKAECMRRAQEFLRVGLCLYIFWFLDECRHFGKFLYISILFFSFFFTPFYGGVLGIFCVLCIHPPLKTANATASLKFKLQMRSIEKLMFALVSTIMRFPVQPCRCAFSYS
jgi:hypothetical protein